MSFLQSFIPEFEHEAKGARSVMELAPDSLLDWKAHETLHTIGWVASHIADTYSWVEVTLKESSFDIAPVGGESHQTPVLDTTEAILKSFDENLASAKQLFNQASDESMGEPWTLLQGDNEIFTMPRGGVVKMLFVNHIVHHRAFLVAYLRMNDIVCPSLYGG